MIDFIRENKKIILLSVVFILIMAGVVILMSYSQKQTIVSAHKESLQILADEKAAQIKAFFEFQKEKSLIINSIDVFKEAAKDSNNSQRIELAKNRINELKSIIPGISILTSEGIVIVGDIDLPGTDYSDSPYFGLPEKKVVFERYYDPLRKKNYYAVVGPIYDKIERNKIIGAISFDLELGDISTLMKETLNSETHEVYLIDENGLLLSGSKYVGLSNGHGILTQEVKSDGATICLEDIKKYSGNHSMTEPKRAVFSYSNYVGNEVFGARAYAPDINGCVIAEEGAGEIPYPHPWDFIKNIFKREAKDGN